MAVSHISDGRTNISFTPRILPPGNRWGGVYFRPSANHWVEAAGLPLLNSTLIRRTQPLDPNGDRAELTQIGEYVESGIDGGRHLERRPAVPRYVTYRSQPEAKFVKQRDRILATPNFIGRGSERLRIPSSASSRQAVPLPDGSSQDPPTRAAAVLLP